MNLDIRIIAYGLSSKKLMLKLVAIIPPAYLHPSYQLFYKLLLKCFEKFNEVPTLKVMEEQAKAMWDATLTQTYVDALNEVIDEREFPADAEQLKIRYNTQVMLRLGQDVFVQGREGDTFTDLQHVNKVLKKAVTTIDSIYSTKVFKEGSLAETAIDTWNDYKKVKDNPDIARGVHLGYREFDRITNGIQAAELMLIGGEAGAGKSTLAMNMAVNAWLGGITPPKSVNEITTELITNAYGANVLYFTLEMPYKAQRRRLDACTAGISLYGIRDGNLTPQEEELFKASLKFQKCYEKQFHVIDIPRGCTVSYIESKFIEKCYEFTPDLVVVDYISLMSPDEKTGSDWLDLGRIAEQLHEFCRTYNVPTISPVQLTRPQKSNGKKDDNNVADQSRVGRSFMFVQNANIILNIESRSDEETRRDMVVRIAKMRDGERTSFVLNKRLDIMRIYDDVPDWEPVDVEEDNAIL